MDATPENEESDADDDFDALSDLEWVVADIERIEAVAAATVDAFDRMRLDAMPGEQRAVSRLYVLVTVVAQTAEAVRAGGDERIVRLHAQRKARRRPPAPANDTEDFDELARLGARRHLSPKLRLYATLVRDAQAAVERTKRKLDQWLAAVEVPLDAGAGLIVCRMQLEHEKGAERGLPAALVDEASNFVYRVLDGAAVRSHEGGLVPECPGLGAPDQRCGAPVHEGHMRCATCEARSMSVSSP